MLNVAVVSPPPATGRTPTCLPLYQLMTALPQLISRICHSHSGVFKEISNITATLMATYPQQVMWHMVAVSKSSYNVRVQRCLEILELAKRKKPGLNKLINDVTKLADRFIELSNKQVDKHVTVTSVSSLVRSLPRLLNEDSFSAVLIPIQDQMTVQLPSRAAANHNAPGEHYPFPR